MDYYLGPTEKKQGYRLSNYVRSCWQTIRPKTNAVKAFLVDRGYKAESLNIPQRAAACRAGLGFIGRNTMFYAHELGSYVGIACIGTDMILNETESFPEQVMHPQCKNCSCCISSCPVQAITGNGYQINPMKCLSMLNRHPDESKCILPNSSNHYEGWLYGCETCQEVCPLNANIKHKFDAVVEPEITIAGMTLPNKTSIDKSMLESEYSKISSPGYRDYVEQLLLG